MSMFYAKNNTIFVNLCIFVISYKKQQIHPLISNGFGNSQSLATLEVY